MEHYGGVYRHSGRGLGNIFGLLSRVALPFLKRTAVPILKRQAKRLAPKLLKAGVGVASDIISKKRNAKQSVHARGAQFIRDSINSAKPKRKRQSSGNTRRVRGHRKDVFD